MLEIVKRAVSQTYTLARPYWTSEEKRTAWGLLVAMIALQGLEVFLLARLTYEIATLFDSLDLRNFADVGDDLLRIFIVASLALASYVIEQNFRYALIVNWRQHLTENYLAKYTSRSTFNQLELADYNIDNPDQRISVDINNSVTQTLDLSMNLIGNIGRLFAFSYILWTVSGEFSFPIAGQDVTIPGYMFWVALFYAAVFTAVTHFAGRRLIPLKSEQQQVEADFRFHLARMREHSDSIAMGGGGPRETRDLMKEFSIIKSNWMQLLIYERRLIGLRFGFLQMSAFFPILAALPALMAGTIAIGGVLQLRAAFGTVVNTLSWFALVYSRLAEWRASVNRVIQFDAAIKAAETDLKSSRISHVEGEADALLLEGLTLQTPAGETLIDRQSLRISAGENTVISGQSGSGKTTLFRAIAGQWPWGAGRIQVPRGKLFFVPQIPYVPNGRLRNVLAYPGDTDDHSTADVVAALEKCNVAHLATQLDATQDWARSLSGGEKQRLALARAILARPDWLFMDEATTAMDGSTEARVFETLIDALPDATIVLITHGDTRSPAFSRRMHLDHDSKAIQTIDAQDHPRNQNIR